MQNSIGDKCFADTMRVDMFHNYCDGKGRKVRRRVAGLFAEVDGIEFDSDEYPTKKAWLQDIINRVYACAMGQLNCGEEQNKINRDLIKNLK